MQGRNCLATQRTERRAPFIERTCNPMSVALGARDGAPQNPRPLTVHRPRPNGGSPQGRTGHRTRGRGCLVAEAPRFAARLSAAGPQRTSWAAHLPWRGRALPKGEAPLSLRKTAGGSATPLPGRGRARARPASEGPRSAKRRGAAHPHTMAGAIRQTQPSPRRCLATTATQSPGAGTGLGGRGVPSRRGAALRPKAQRR